MDPADMTREELVALVARLTEERDREAGFTDSYIKHLHDMQRQRDLKQRQLERLKAWRTAVLAQLGIKGRMSRPNGACAAILELQNKVRKLEN